MRIAMVAEGAEPEPALGAGAARGREGDVCAWATHLARAGNSVELSVGRQAPGLVEHSEQEGLETRRLPKPPSSPESWDAATEPIADALAEQWREEPPDLIHTWGMLAAAAARRAVGDRPLVHTFTDLRSLQSAHRMVRGSRPAELALEQQLAYSATRCVVHCGAVLAKLRALEVSRSDISSLPVGVDTRRFSTDVPGVERSPGGRLVTVASPPSLHDLQGVLSALREVPETELLVVGGPRPAELDGDETIGALRKHARQVGVEHRVRFLGQVPHREAPALLRSADLLVQYPTVPSHASMVPAAQALACGVPVVAADLGGLGRIAGTRKPSPVATVPPRDARGLARCLRTLLDEPKRRREMARLAPSVKHGWTDWTTAAGHAADLYREVLDARAARTPAAVSAAPGP
ncbi:glycosyltransferase [Egibacter rhizosphaerae]|nr:glycosyltransferase [Egibacter rhizosphaerae]